MQKRFRIRLDELLQDAEVGPAVLRGMLPRLERFLGPFVASLTDAQGTHAHHYVAGLVSDLQRKNEHAGKVNRTLTTADLNVADSDTTGACGLHVASIPIPTSAQAVPVSPNNPAQARDAFFALLSNPPSATGDVSAALFANIAQDGVFANSAKDFGTLLPTAGQTASRVSAVFAPGTATDDSPFASASIFPDSVGDGSEDRAPMAPPSVQPDAGSDFIPANGAFLLEV